MARFLLIDIGAGTMDILFYDSEVDVHYKAVVKSPVKHIAEKAAGLPGNLLATGNEMGGGEISQVLKNRAKESKVLMSISAAATVHHDLERVRSFGIQVVSDEKAETLSADSAYRRLIVKDLSVDRIKRIVEGMGVSFSFDVVGVCAQDHGVASSGVSHLDFRHDLFKKALNKNPSPHALLYKGDEVPGALNRLSCIGKNAQALPTKEVYVMDSGMAAILGASMDHAASSKEKILVLDLATSHTLGAALMGEEIAGFFEYHTRDVTLDRLEKLMIDLADGKLVHRQVIKEGGHGAYIRTAFGFDETEIIIATGPKRRLVEGCRLPLVMGAPLGDNMMTGTVGLLEAIRRRKGLSTINYI